MLYRLLNPYKRWQVALQPAKIFVYSLYQTLKLSLKIKVLSLNINIATWEIKKKRLKSGKKNKDPFCHCGILNISLFVIKSKVEVLFLISRNIRWRLKTGASSRESKEMHQTCLVSKDTTFCDVQKQNIKVLPPDWSLRTTMIGASGATLQGASNPEKFTGPLCVRLCERKKKMYRGDG